MLARSFKSAEQLGIKQTHYDALVMCLHAMERGEVQHLPSYPLKTDSSGPRRPFGFNMDAWCIPTSCGTVGCIGGTAEALGKLRWGELKRTEDRSLIDLFHPRVYTDWRNITTEQAAQALSNYLTTGEPDWRGVMGE